MITGRHGFSIEVSTSTGVIQPSTLFILCRTQPTFLFTFFLVAAFSSWAAGEDAPKWDLGNSLEGIQVNFQTHLFAITTNLRAWALDRIKNKYYGGFSDLETTSSLVGVARAQEWRPIETS